MVRRNDFLTVIYKLLIINIWDITKTAPTKTVLTNAATSMETAPSGIVTISGNTPNAITTTKSIPSFSSGLLPPH